MNTRPPKPPVRRCTVSVNGVRCPEPPRYPGRDESSFCVTHDDPDNAETKAWQAEHSHYGNDHAWLSGRLIDDPEALRRLDRLARHEPSPAADGLRDRQIEEFMGWLFRDGGAEPPRREYDAVEQRLRLLVNPPDGAPKVAAKVVLDLGYYYGETHYYDPNEVTTCWLRSDGAGSSVPVEDPALIELLNAFGSSEALAAALSTIPEPTGDWWTDGAMVNEGRPGDEGFVGDAATEDDAARIVERHNSILREARS